MFNPYKFPKDNIIGLNESLSAKADSSIIASPFNSAATYAVGSYTIYNGLFYKCTTAHSGAWDATHFTNTLVSDEFGSGGGGEADVTVKDFRQTSWTGLSVLYGKQVWSDGEVVYSSNNASQYVLNKTTTPWSWDVYTWDGSFKQFFGEYVWTDGTDYYYSYGTTHYVLDKPNNQWVSKTWTGLTDFYPKNIWKDLDGEIYFSNAGVTYKLDVANSTWESVTFTSFVNPVGEYVWSDGSHVYYSNNNAQYVFDKANMIWTAVSWTGLTNPYGSYIWSDGEDVFYSYQANQYKLDKDTERNWKAVTWLPSNVDATFVWTDGTNYYFCNGSPNYQLLKLSIVDIFGQPNGLATLDANGKLKPSQTNYVTAGQKSGTTLGQEATAEGHTTTSSGSATHAEGNSTKATADASHAEGFGTEATGGYSHAEGYQSKATSSYAHAEGHQTTASGSSSHTEGENTKASGNSAHAEGWYTTASNNYSHAEGANTQTGATYQHVQGKYNVGKADTLFEIGNGTANNARANAFEVSDTGDVVAAGDITDGSGNVLANMLGRNGDLMTKPLSVRKRSSSGIAYQITNLQTYAKVKLVIYHGSLEWYSYDSGGTATMEGNDTIDDFPAYCVEVIDASTSKVLRREAVDRATSIDLLQLASGSITININLYIASVIGSGTNYQNIVAAGEVIDGALNQLSDKFDANSFVLQNFRVTVASTAWSSTATDGYYTCPLTLSYPINTYKRFGMELTGSADGVDPTAAESAAFSLVNYMDASDGTGVTAVTLRAKTKPTTTFYIMVSGYYMQRNAATSGVAVDIKTANKLKLSYDPNEAYIDFDGSVQHMFCVQSEIREFSSSNWSSTVDSDGYYTNTVYGTGYNTYMQPKTVLCGSDKNTVPTSAQIAAYNLVDVFYMPDSLNTSKLVAKAKTKPTTTFYVMLNGYYMA